MKYIEDILLLNKIMSYRILIYKRYSWKSKVLILLPFLLGVLTMTFMLIKLIGEKNLLYFLLLIPFFILWVFSSAYTQYTNKKIVQTYYGYALKDGKNWNYKTILKIRKRELSRLLDNKGLLKKDNLLFLMESVKYHSESKHKFNFLWNAIIILASVYLGGFLSGNMNYYKDFPEFLNFYKNFAIIIGVLILMAWTIDKTMIRDFIENKMASRNRLLRTLENIYIEKYAT